MVKIIIPDSDEKVIVQRNKLEVNVEIGELVLVTDALRFRGNVRKSARLGVFHAIEKTSGLYERIDLGNHYALHSCNEKFGGVYLPIISFICGTVRLSPFLRDFYVGQQQIVQALQSWPGFEAHAEWVARLRKPYLE